MGGQIAMMFDQVSTSAAQVRGGKLRALAVTSRTRSQVLPEVPTLQELGFADFDDVTWNGIVAPAATPPQVVSFARGRGESAFESRDEEEVRGARHRSRGERLARSSRNTSAPRPMPFSGWSRRPVSRWSEMSACDTHFHVFGPEERYPYSSDLRYTPPSAPLEDYLGHARELGASSAYSCSRAPTAATTGACSTRCASPVRNAAAASSTSRTPASRARAAHAAGVQGVRINVNPIKPPEPGFSMSLMKRIRTLDAKCAALGWMLDFLAPGWLTRELIPVLRDLQ